MESLYLPLRHTHLLFVTISILFFIVRGGFSITGKQWQERKGVKIAAHSIDTLLLLTGVSLMFATGFFPPEQAWLTAKLVLLVGYIMFGIQTMKNPSIMKRRSYYAAAIICVLFMVTIARSHHPLGLFSVL
ncbi:hypothetical protein NBRC116188_04980 [Oceaniserpentilla sp. 4NH20-0058]|uniref:SirB2 family protein n=1 Tax=Oceaniserpentilla sp. 4NH20-0058 TaxID=3127660 RepID=UPI0031057F6E